MKVSRRDFIHAGCAIAAATLAPHFLDAAKAGINNPGSGSSASLPNNNRVTVNVPPGGFMNLAKVANFNSPAPLAPSAVDANGYPTSTPANTSADFKVVPNYYGKYVWKWSGRGSMQISGVPTIVYSGPISGSTDGNTNAFDLTGPIIVFKFGAFVASVSGGSGSLVTITTTSSLMFGAGLTTGFQISFAVGCSANLSSGPNSDGSWTITNVNGTQFTLNGSTGVVSPTVTGIGGANVQTEAVIQVAGTSLLYANTGTFTAFTNLVFCKAADEQPIFNGQIYDPLLVSQIQYLMNSASRGSPGWLRFMDVSGVQGSYECDFAQRCTATAQFWGGLKFPAVYQAGAITRAAGDAYTCANPSGSPVSGAPVDCEIVQGTPSATNTAGSPTLTVTGRTGTWPIIDGKNPFTFRFSGGPASAGLTMQWTFTATWLNGGTPYVFSYTTVASDIASIPFLNAHLQTAMLADAVLSAGNVIFTNSAQLVAFPRTPLAGALTIAYTSGPAICTIIQLDVSAIATTPATFIFNKLLGGFVYVNAGLFQGIPFEAMVDLCTRVGAHCWYTWPIYTKGQYITDVTNFFATNLVGYKFGAEMGNEIWNSAAQLFVRAQIYGFALNFPNGGLAAPYGWQGLRTVQYAALSRAAWATAGRIATDHYILTMSATFDVDLSTNFGNFDANVLQGVQLVNSNGVYALYSGLGATAGTSYNVAGSQPVDSSDAIGCAPYWGSPWFNGQATDLAGVVTDYAPPLQAAKDYGAGLFTTAYTSMVNQFNGITTRGSGASGANTLGTTGNNGYTTIFTREEAQAAQYDARRLGAGKAKLALIHYEGGPQWAMGADLNNGVNGVFTADITALANRMTALSWNVSAYTTSGTNNATEMATMVLTLAQAWKHDASYKNLIETYYYQAVKAISAANREVKPAQYGYSASQWGLFPGSYIAGNQYQNYDAIHEFNA